MMTAAAWSVVGDELHLRVAVAYVDNRLLHNSRATLREYCRKKERLDIGGDEWRQTPHWADLASPRFEVDLSHSPFDVTVVLTAAEIRRCKERHKTEPASVIHTAFF